MDDELIAEIQRYAHETRFVLPMTHRFLSACLAEIARLRRELVDECQESARLRELLPDEVTP